MNPGSIVTLTIWDRKKYALFNIENLSRGFSTLANMATAWQSRLPLFIGVSDFDIAPAASESPIYGNNINNFLQLQSCAKYGWKPAFEAQAWHGCKCWKTPRSSLFRPKSRNVWVSQDLFTTRYLTERGAENSFCPFVPILSTFSFTSLLTPSLLSSTFRKSGFISNNKQGQVYKGVFWCGLFDIMMLLIPLASLL
jgi:hypothetical protein